MKGLKNFLKRSLSCALTLALAIPSIPVYATSETNVNFNVSATTIDITVPLNFACAIDPNEDNGFTYASNLTITNNTKAPIELSISDFSDTSSTFENDILPSELPSGKTWDKLNVSDTKKYFSLGINASNSNEWLEYYPTEKVYAKKVQEGAVTLGAIDPGVSVNFDLDASYGRAVKDSFTFSYKVTWMATLYEGDTSGASLFAIDEENSSNLNYELNASSPNYLDVLPNYLDNPEGEEIDSSKVVGTCQISGLKDNSLDNITVCDYYKDASGNLYKIVGIKTDALDNATNLDTIYVQSEKVNNSVNRNIVNNTDYNYSNLYIDVNNLADINGLWEDEIVEEKTIIYDASLTNGGINQNCSFGSPVEDSSFSTYIANGTNCSGHIAITKCTYTSNSSDKKAIIPTYYKNTDGKYYVVNEISYEESSEAAFLGNIFIPKTITIIDSQAINNVGIGSFSKITVSSENPNFKSYNNFIVDKNGTTLYASINKSRTKVVVPYNVTEIKPYAFADGSYEYIHFNNVTQIGEHAFNRCESLQDIVLNNVSTIDAYAFFLCNSLGSVIVPDTVTTIGADAFSGAKNVIYNGSASDENGNNWGASYKNGYLENGLLYENESKTTLMKYVGSEKNVVIPNGVTTVNSLAFSGSNVINVTVPNSVTSLNSQSFKYVLNVIYNGTLESSTNWGATCKNGYIEGDFLYTDSTKKEICKYLGTDYTIIVIPDGVTTINKYAISSSSPITVSHFVLPKSLQTLGSSNGYDSSTTFYYKGTEEEWSNLGFSGSYSSIVYDFDGSLENGLFFQDAAKTILVKYVGNDTTINIPSSVIEIKTKAFYNCSFIDTIYVPNTVTTIGTNAFYKVKAIMYNGSASDSNNWGATLMNSIVDGDFAFSDESKTTLTKYLGTSLTSVTIPSTVTTIGAGTFRWCTSLTSVTIPSTVTTIEDSAFYGCSNIKNLTVPDTVTTIGKDAFCDVPNIIYNGSATCSGSQTNYWGATMKNNYIDGDFAYQDNTKTYLLKYLGSNDTTLVLPNTIEKIGYQAFSGKSFTSIVIPTSVTTIYRFGFDGSKVSTVYYRGTEEQWSQIDISSEYNDKVINATKYYNYTE